MFSILVSIHIKISCLNYFSASSRCWVLISRNRLVPGSTPSEISSTHAINSCYMWMPLLCFLNIEYHYRCVSHKSWRLSECTSLINSRQQMWLPVLPSAAFSIWITRYRWFLLWDLESWHEGSDFADHREMGWDSLALIWPLACGGPS